MWRCRHTRDVPSNMNLFPNDIATAEHLTGGNPNIIKDDEFAPEEKADYSDLFGPKKSPGKKLKPDSIKKEYGNWRLKHIKESTLKNGRKSLPAIPTRAITHPRFINKAILGQSDHEVRIRHQVTTPLREDDPVSSSPVKQYNCHICGFTSSRLNVIVLHNKSHSAGFADTYLATSPSSLKRPKLKDYSVPTAIVKSRVKSTPRRLLLGLDTPKRKKERSPKESKAETEERPVTSTPKKDKVDAEDKPSAKKPEFGKRKYTKEKKQNAAKQKQENVAIRETLLKDWDEDDEVQEEAEMEQIKQIKEGKTDDERNEKTDNCKDDKVDDDKTEQVKTGTQPRLLGKRSLRFGKSQDNKEDSSKGKETSCFDFDDSDEGIRLDGTVMKFGMKIPRVLGEDKTKRKSVDFETAESIGTVKDNDNKEKNLEDGGKKDEEDIKLESAFASLLEETAVPVIPDVPKNVTAFNTLDCIKSVSTDVQGIKSIGPDVASDMSDINSTKEMDSLSRPNTVQENNISAGIVDEIKAETNTPERLPEMVESNPICNISEVASINAKDFESAEDLNEFESKSDLQSEEKLVVSETATNGSENKMDIESPLEDVSLKNEYSDDNVSSSDKFIKTSETGVSSNKIELMEISQENEAKEYPDNSEAISDVHTSENRESGSDKSTYVKENDEICIEKEVDTNNENFKDKKLTQSDEINEDNFVTESDSKTSVKENIQSSISSSPVKTKLDLQNIVNDIKIEETTTVQQGVENESNIEITTTLAEIEQSKITPDIKKEIALKIERNELEIQNVNMIESDKFQDMPFDINSMPVIIGEDLIQPEESKTPIVLTPDKPMAGDILMQQQNKNVIMISNQASARQSEPVVSSSKVIQSVISVAGKDGQIIAQKSLGQKPVTTVKTIKLPQGSSLNKLTKSGANQVLILKTASGQSSKIAVGKSNLQKLGTQQIIQQSGGKVLILTNPQTSGQGKITTLTPQQQVLTSGGKLPPGTRLITTKGTVLSTSGAQTVTLGKSTVQKAGGKGGQKYVISTTSKNMMISKSGILTPITSTATKSQAFITQNVVTSKGNLIVPSSSQISKSPTVVTQAITTNKGMILTPMTNKGLISGNQKVRIVTSTAPASALTSGARIVVQNPQSKVVTIPQQKNQKIKIVSSAKGQPSGNTLLIQTSQGHPAILTSTISTNQITTKPKLIPVSKTLPQITSQIVPRLTVPQTQPQILTKKAGVQKVRQASPNILQKSQKKVTARGQKNFTNQLISPQTISAPAQETILLSSTGLPSVVDQSNIMKTGLPQGDGTALIYLTVDESGNYRPLTDNSLVSFEGTQQDSRTLYIDPSTTDMDNIFLTIDNAGNVVNITQPAPSTFTSESSLPSQDILAKALANTQVLQPETIIPDTVVPPIVSSTLDHSSAGLNSSFTEQAQYPAPSLSHSVLETSLTLNQPIMTPLEVPSAVVSTPNLSQITSLPSSFIHSNLLTSSKSQLLRPSMPLLELGEDSDSSRQTEPVYLLDGAHNIITPVTSGSLSLQLTLNDNVIVSSQGGEASLIPSTYQVVSNNMLTSDFNDPSSTFKTDAVRSLNDTNSIVETSLIIQPNQREMTIPTEDFNRQENQSESHITTDFLNDVESKNIESALKTEISDSLAIEGNGSVEVDSTDHYLNEEIDKPSLKRSIEEVCDIKPEIEGSPKRVKIEER